MKPGTLILLMRGMLNQIVPAKTVEARLVRVETLLIVLLLQSPIAAALLESVLSKVAEARTEQADTDNGR